MVLCATLFLGVLLFCGYMVCIEFLHVDVMCM